MQDAEAGSYQNKGASKVAIQYHYDAGDAFFERLLGRTMGYSAGLWIEPAKSDTYDNSQKRKLDWHIDWSGADTGRRVLDVGCGWGSLIRRLAERNPRARVTGLTISDAQARYLRREFGNLADIQLMPWQTFNCDEPFDSIVNIEAIEHFARFDIKGPARVQAYRDFFEFCARRLAPGGKLTLQMTTWHNVDASQEEQFEADIVRAVFPETCLPRIPELVAASDGLFHLIRLESSPRDYLYTMREWIRRLRRIEAELTREFGADLVRRNLDYFEMNINGYLTGALSLVRMALERRGTPFAWDLRTRPTVARWSAKKP